MYSPEEQNLKLRRFVGNPGRKGNSTRIGVKPIFYRWIKDSGRKRVEVGEGGGGRRSKGPRAVENRGGGGRRRKYMYCSKEL